MTRSVTLRPWQRDALDAFARRSCDDVLVVACPGAGKTTFALAAARQYLGGEHRPIVVVVPTQHLKQQWAEAATRFGIHLDHQWNGRSAVAPDMHGIVTTYAQAASATAVLAGVSAGGIVVLDEVHHAADDRAWGTGVRDAFAGASCRLLLSGTPFRTDDNPIPFVRYSFGDYGDALADVEYGYGEALADGGVVRPVFFPRFDGHMEWRAADGEEHSATFNDDLVRAQWGARLRTALSPEGEWLPSVLDKAHERLTDIRRTHPEAGGLVIATDHEHAHAVARLLKRRHRIDAAVALSDDPQASARIARFAGSSEPWIIAVRMISEGVDIPRLRVGVFATTTATPMFFRQAVGRIARWTPGLRSQRAYLYVPDDPRLRLHALDIATARRHSIEFRRGRRDAEEGEFDRLPATERAEDQLSLFAALSSSVLGSDEPPADGIDPHEDVVAEPSDSRSFTIDLPPPPPLPGRMGDLDVGAGRSRRGEKTRWRDRNALLVADLVRVTGLGHRQINAELNRLAGIVRVDDATVAQLARRAEHATTWLDDPADFVPGRGRPTPVSVAGGAPPRPAPRLAEPEPIPVGAPGEDDDAPVSERLARLRRVLSSAPGPAQEPR